MVIETSRASGTTKWTFYDELDVIFGNFGIFGRNIPSTSGNQFTVTILATIFHDYF